MRATPPAWIAEHRAVWARKAAIRAVYRQWVGVLRAAAAPGRSIVEIGCGPGFVKELWPDVLATDVVPSPYAEQQVDATAMPFAAGEVSNLVLVDVFHHLPAPAAFLREAARVLHTGGRLLMIEPWLGIAGRLFYRYIHHESCDPRVSAEAPWGARTKDAMVGNAALPFVFFAADGHLERSGLPLRIIHREPFGGLAWLLSGGFRPVTLLPCALVGTVGWVDRVISRVPALTATRCFLVAERVA